MKANRKFRDADNAVSAVIGVILMVAITVAIAATVYVYVSGMIGTSPETTPALQFVKNDTDNKLTVATADPGSIAWADFTISTNLSASTHLLSWSTGDTVTAGDNIYNITGCQTITVLHIGTNTLIGTWNFN